jgi:murein L,D-transpeptidase YcbB/YkuD
MVYVINLTRGVGFRILLWMLTAKIMEPTNKATGSPAQANTPLRRIKILKALKVILLFDIRIIALAGLFVLSTSYQGHQKGQTLLEHDFFLPAFTDSMMHFFNSTNEITGIDNLRVFPLVRAYYRTSGYKPVWTYNFTISENAIILLDLINNAEKFGLKKNTYNLQEISNKIGKIKRHEEGGDYLSDRINLELLLSDACLTFMIHLKMGYQKFDSSFFTLPVANIMLSEYSDVLESNDFKNAVLSIQPKFIEYVRLRQSAEKYSEYANETDEKVFIPDPKKDSVAFRKEAEKVLIKLHFLNHCPTDDEYIAALKAFQYYHGLEPDGKPGRNTCEALSRSAHERYRQIALNLDRLRKDNFRADHFILVNIPAYQVRIYKANKVIGNTRVIVGAPKTPTPLITSRIQKIITNPSWEVPRSITLNEMLPKLMTDSSFLNRKRFMLIDENQKKVEYHQIDWTKISTESFGYRLKQDAGSDNALGSVKFIFPSPYPVYLHDTPGKKMFSKDIRAFSHGCIRVQNPDMLAEYLVREFSKESENIDVSQLIHNGVSREIILDQPVDIYIRYITCEADDNQHVFFYKDIYRLDEKELSKDEFLQ